MPRGSPVRRRAQWNNTCSISSATSLEEGTRRNFLQPEPMIIGPEAAMSYQQLCRLVTQPSIWNDGSNKPQIKQTIPSLSSRSGSKMIDLSFTTKSVDLWTSCIGQQIQRHMKLAWATSRAHLRYTMITSRIYDVTAVAADQIRGSISSWWILRLGPPKLDQILPRTFVSFPLSCSQPPTVMVMVCKIFLLVPRRASLCWSARSRSLVESPSRIVTKTWFAICVISSRKFDTITTTTYTKPTVFVSTVISRFSTSSYQSRGPTTGPFVTLPLILS